MVKRRLYKPERKPARKKGVFKVGKNAPVALPDATPGEIAMAVYAISIQAGVEVGRGTGYDGLKDEYSVVGKSKATGRVQEFKLKGEEVATAIRLFRLLNGGPAVPGQLQ